jgi:trafficking protein particle complex subunit 11
MNSYPIELLCQHAPLMFVAGLDLPKDTKDPFHSLVARLRESFLSRPKGLIWDQERSKNFNILLVDKVSRREPHIHISY